jgi:hypothetical protein
LPGIIERNEDVLEPVDDCGLSACDLSVIGGGHL